MNYYNLISIKFLLKDYISKSLYAYMQIIKLNYNLIFEAFKDKII